MEINSLTKNKELIKILNNYYPELKLEFLDEDLVKDIIDSFMENGIVDLDSNKTIKDEIEKNYDFAWEHIPEMLCHSKLIILNGKINNIPIKILLDTGANINCIYKSKIIEAELENIIDNKSKNNISGLQSYKETVGKIWYTEIELEIISTSKNKSHAMIGLNLMVVDDEKEKHDNSETFDLILGLTFMKSYETIIDFSKNIITLNNNIQIKFE